MAPWLVLALILGHLVWRWARAARRSQMGSAPSSPASPGPSPETTMMRLGPLASEAVTNCIPFTLAASPPMAGTSSATPEIGVELS